jgi:hypothetical protein
LPIGIIHGIGANPATGRNAKKRKNTMLKTFAAVLIAASMLSAPAFAQNTSPAPQAPAAQAVKAPAVKVVKAKKHQTMKKHVWHVRHHVRHASVKRTHRAHHVTHVARVAGKHATN